MTGIILLQVSHRREADPPASGGEDMLPVGGGPLNCELIFNLEILLWSDSELTRVE